MEIVEVEWFDAQEETDALTLEEAKRQEPFPVKSVGFLIKKDKKKVIIALSCFHPDSSKEFFRSVWTIPKGMVKNIRRLQ